MGYKFKPNKAVAKRFKVTKTGKVKRHHAFTSHLMSSRSANKRRRLRRSAIMHEGLARNMRQLMGVSHLKPGQIKHERALAAKKAGDGDAAAPANRAGASTRVARAPRAASKIATKSTTKAPARAGAAKPPAR